MLIVICPITYWRLLYVEFTMMWRVLRLMWWMSLIGFLSICGGVLKKKNLCIRLCLLFLEQSWWGRSNFWCRNWGVWYCGEGCAGVWVVRYPGIGHVLLWFWHWGSICQYYRDRFWCCGAAHSSDLKGATRRGADQHRWHGAVPGILDWDGAGQSGTDQRRASRIGTKQGGAGQV